MERRRALLSGGKKEPLYIFKEGEGMLATVTSKSSYVTVNNSYITYDLYRNVYLNIEQSFDGYNKLCFEGKSGKYTNDEGTTFYKSAGLGYGSSELKTRKRPEVYVELLAQNTRGTVSLDISGLSGNYYIQLGHPQSISTSDNYIDYIYNIWLE